MGHREAVTARRYATHTSEFAQTRSGSGQPERRQALCQVVMARQALGATSDSYRACRHLVHHHRQLSAPPLWCLALMRVGQTMLVGYNDAVCTEMFR